MKDIYLDNAATTKVDSRVLKKMMPYYTESYANASSIHFPGQKNDLKIKECKKNIAKIIGASADNIVFTATATEANNFIIKGVMRANRDKGKHFLISSIEHPSVLETARVLSQEGFNFDYIKVDSEGIVDLNDLERKIKPDTVLISVLMINNEIGTIQPISEIAKIAKKNGVFFHSDAVQAVPYLKINVEKSGIDFLTLSAHKFYGPQGVAVACINKKIKIEPFILGGGQEDSYRSGTYNMAGIVGLTEALKLAYKERDKYIKKVKDLRDLTWRELKKEIPGLHLNGSWKKRSPNNLNIMIEGVEGEAVLIDLSLAGIAISTGSACSATNLKTSSVITAMGINPKYINSNIRLTWGRYNNMNEVSRLVKTLKKTVARLRDFSSVYEK